MALKALDPAPTEDLGSGWELVASEGGRSNKGLQATVTLFNGTAQAFQTLPLGDPTAQQALAATFAPLAAVDVHAVTKALAQLAVAVEGTLRQMDADVQADDHPSQATRLVALATDAGAELFHTPEKEAYAYLLNNPGSESSCPDGLPQQRKVGIIGRGMHPSLSWSQRPYA